MAGTFHQADDPDVHELTADHPLVRAFLADLAAALPALELDRAGVRRVLWGRLPAAAAGGDVPAARPVVRRHADHGGPAGLVSVSGVKYTTARALAETALRTLLEGDLPATRDVPRPPQAEWPSRAELDSGGDDDAELGARLRRLAAEESVVHVDDLILRRTDLGLDPEVGAAMTRQVTGLLASARTGGPPA